MKIQIDDQIIDADEEQAAALRASQDDRVYPVADFPQEETTPE